MDTTFRRKWNVLACLCVAVVALVLIVVPFLVRRAAKRNHHYRESLWNPIRLNADDEHKDGFYTSGPLLSDGRASDPMGHVAYPSKSDPVVVNGCVDYVFEIDTLPRFVIRFSEPDLTSGKRNMILVDPSDKHWNIEFGVDLPDCHPSDLVGPIAATLMSLQGPGRARAVTLEWSSSDIEPRSSFTLLIMFDAQARHFFFIAGKGRIKSNRIQYMQGYWSVAWCQGFRYASTKSIKRAECNMQLTRLALGLNGWIKEDAGSMAVTDVLK